ncbi:MAG: hypothetical protein R2752_09820 [Vicinamibacterales bacterium]
MDWLVDQTVRLWIGALMLVLLPLLLFVLVRALVFLLRRVPPLRTPLAPAAAWLARAYWALNHTGMVLFGVALVWPILVVAIPVAGLALLLLRWLVSDVPDETSLDHHDAQPRVPSLRTMDWPLRLITLTTVAQLVASAVLLWVVKSPADPIHLAAGAEMVRIDRLVVWTTGAFLAVGFGLLLAGTWVRLFSRALVVAVFGIVSRPTDWNGPAATIWLGWMLVLAGVSLAPLLHRVRPAASAPGAGAADGSATPAAPPVGFVRRAVVFAGGFAAFHLATAAAMGGGTPVYATYLQAHVAALAVLLVPVLFLAGTDFAELADTAGRQVARVAAATGRHRRTRIGAAVVLAIGAGLALQAYGHVDLTGLESIGVLAAAVAVFAVGLGVGTTLAESGWAIVRGIGYGFVVAGGVGAFLIFARNDGWALMTAVAAGFAAATVGVVTQRVRPGRWSPNGIPVAALVVLALGLAGTREVVAFARAQYGIPPGAATTRFEVQRIGYESGVFSLALPEGWQVTERPNGILQFGRGPDLYTDGGAALVIVELDAATATTTDNRLRAAALAWPDLEPDRLEFVGTLGADPRQWLLHQATVSRDGRRYRVSVWSHVDDGATRWWVIVTVSAERFASYYAGAFARLVSSWRRDDSAAAPEPIEGPDLHRRITRVGGFGFLPVLFAPVGWMLLYRTGDRQPTGSPRDHAGLLAIVVAATAILFLPDTTLIEFWRGSEANPNPLASLQLVAVAGTAIVFLRAIVARPMGRWAGVVAECVGLNVAILVLALVYGIYGAAIPLGAHHVAIEAAIFVVALLWDLLMSGREITNVDGPVFRRPARVLAYLGYLVVVAATVLFISAQTTEAGGAVEKVLESEDVVRQGVVWLGTPLLLTRFALRVGPEIRALFSRAGRAVG